MIYRKTWFDYVLWVIYAGICIILLGYVGYSMYSFYVGESLASLGVFVLVALLLCLYPGSRVLGRLIRKNYHFSNHFLSMTETLVISVSFVFGTILRLKEGIIWASIFEVTASCIAIQYRKTIKKPTLRAKLVLDGNTEDIRVLDGNFEEDWGDCLYLEPVLHHGEKKEHRIEIEILDDKTEKATPFYLISLVLA